MIAPYPKVEDRTAQTDTRVYNNRPVGTPIDGILLHHTGSRSEAGDIQWLTTWHQDPVSCHKVFKRDGTIVKIVADRFRAWHAGASLWHGREDCNDWMLGYEICNDGLGETYTPEQYEALAHSIAYDCALYHIPDAEVTTHKAVRDAWLMAHPGSVPRKTDPKGLDIARIWRRVREIRQDWPYDPQVPLWCCMA